MKPARILIIEDDPMISLDLETIVADHIAADIVIANTLAEAHDALSEPVDFAFLDIDMQEGKTFPVAAALRRTGVLFAFVSGSKQEDMPAELRDAPFITKPYSRAEIGNTLRECLDRATTTKDAGYHLVQDLSAAWNGVPRK